MGQCKCGFSTDEENNCNGTHKIVRAVRQKIVEDLEKIEIEASITNALGVKMMAIKIAEGK